MSATEITIRLPDWLLSRHDEIMSSTYASNDARMALAIELASENIKHTTGGPFGAAVFDQKSGQPIAVGVNLVPSTGQSCLHGEVVALAMAHAALGQRDLSDSRLQLATSAEPCTMCLGAIHWAGIRTILIGAHDDDVRAIGFDEGHKPSDWREAFRKAGIDVIEGVRRAEAAAVLQAYRAEGGEIYNAEQAKG